MESPQHPRLVEVVLHVTDFDREVDFWQHGLAVPLLRVTTLSDGRRFANFDLGGPRLEIGLTDHASPPAPRTKADMLRAITLNVPDAKAAAASAAQHGGTVVVPPGPSEGAIIGWITSPCGQAVGLIQGDETNYREALGQRPLRPYWQD